MIAINFQIKAGGSLLFLGLFEAPQALRQIQMLRDNGAYAVITSEVGYDCEECEDTGIVTEREGSTFCDCALGNILHDAAINRAKEALRRERGGF